MNAGQSLKIASGTYTGTVEFGTGASICVETGASFAPGNLNNAAGTLTNYGTASLQTFSYNSGTVIDNYGTLSFVGGLNTNGATTFRNRTNATMNMANSFQLGNNSTFINDGLVVAQQDFNTQNGTTLTNNHRLELEGNFNPDGKFDNYGRVYARKFMNINANSDVSNHCTLVSYDGFNNNSPLMDNQGTILITTASGTPGGPWQNNQAFHNGSSAKIAGGNFINNSTFTGGGFMIFAGDTRNQGAFNGNSAADKITFYDETQTGAQIFDVLGVAPTNTVRTAFVRPTELDAPANCSTQYKSFAVKASGSEDFGDAPASYGDASHAIVAGIQLGQNAPDAEAASQYSFNAAGDGTDEDGAPHYPAGNGPADAALFPVLKMTDTAYTLPITVTNTTGAAGKLYGWIDFNKNGTFEATEAASVAVANGSSNVSVNLAWNSIPLDIKLGTTFIRLRLTSDAAVTASTPTGSASDGEVEDYPIAIYQAIAPDSPSLSIISGADVSTCKTTVFSDDFNDLVSFNWGANVATRQDIRDWVSSGGGPDTYADTHITNATQQMSVYMGNGSVRGISPSFPSGFTFDANGHLTSPINAIALRDVPDDLNLAAKASQWGPESVKLSRTFPTQAGKKYRLYFKAIPEDGDTFAPGIMRVDAPGGSIHFKAPGSDEGIQSYAIEFTASAASSTISFVNYGHISSDWCDPQSSDWCTFGGTTNGTTANELIIDDVTVATVEACDPPPFPTDICGKPVNNPLELDFSGTATLVSGTAKQPGSVYRFSNVSSDVDALVTMNALQADSLPRWLDGDLGGQLQGAQANKYFDMTVNLVDTGTSTPVSPVDLVLTSFDLDGSAGEPYSDGIEYFNPAATFSGTGSQLQAVDMGGSIRYTLPTSARGVDDPTATNPVYAAGAVYTDVTSFRTKGLVVDDNGSSTRSIFIYADVASFEQFDALECDQKVTTSDVSGVIFEDVNYGGGSGRPLGTAGTVGISGARVELYNASGQYLRYTTTTAGGNYSFGTLSDGNYFVRVVSDSVSSSRSGSNGSELAVQTYRRNDAGATITEIGGRNPYVVDAPANTANLALNTSNFTFTGGGQAQSVQPVSIVGGNVSGVSFSFNFDTIVNANDNGQGSLRQFLLNSNLLGGDATLAQTGRTAGKENAILMLLVTDPNYNATGKYWSISTLSALPDITSPLVLDSSTQTSFSGAPVLELNGKNAGAGVNGLTLGTGSNGSSIRNLAINRFGCAGIYINGSNNQTLQANRIGTDPAGATARANTGAGILLNAASNNLIGDASGSTGNLIANNGGDGIAITGAASVANALLGNSIHSNVGLGIDLSDDGVTPNDANDADTGPNNLLNYPAVQATSFATNGSKIITYDFNLDLASGDYRIEFFKSAAKDPSGNGEGQTFLGSKDFSHPGGGVLNFKGSFNANQAVSSSEFVTVTVTEKTGAISFGSTSEFSGSASNNTALVCTDLISNPGAALPDMMIDENATTVTYLKAKDSSGNPITYAISSKIDGGMFTVAPPVNGTIDCAQIQFVKAVIVKDAPAETRAIIPGMVDPGNFEVPLDQGADNVYDIEITATDSTGTKHVRTLSLRVMDVNEAPMITSSAAVSVEEDGSTLALDINSQDQDAVDTEGSTLVYSLTGGTDKDRFTLDTSTGALNFKAVPDYDAPADSNQDNVYQVAVSVTDHGGLTASKTFNITILNRVADDGVKLKARALLQGAYDNNTGLMGNNLNTLGLLPGLQPYNIAPFNHKGTETLGSMVSAGTGNDAIVDWLLVELRTSPTTITASKAVIAQRDGDLVDAQTGSPILHFASTTSGNYYVSVRHRNHLGVLTASPVSLGSTEKLVDFSLAATAVKGTDTRYTSGSRALLWVGDINGSNTLTSSGPSNDTTSLLSSVLGSKDNPNAYTNYALPGYLASDLNMDGKTLFSGPNNDANTLIGNVLLHPLNSNFAANYIVKGGL